MEESSIQLTPAEKIAKKHYQMLVAEGLKYQCDDEQSINNFDMPSWYDEELYNRGQQFYQDNKAGILQSNLVGLLCLLTDPIGLAILQSTDQSSTSLTARHRYISTITHIVTWYEHDFIPGSKSLESLKRVRKLHYLASKSADRKGLGGISQYQMALTAFGFMGFPLVRPELLKIRYFNDEDRKGFVHFWAVMCHMLGVHERFNICLLPIDALIVFCQLMLRYWFLPLIQLEGSEFKEMVQAATRGLRHFIPDCDYELTLFTARQLIIVPGYQYKLDHSKELHCRSIFSQAEVEEINVYFRDYWKFENPLLITADIPLIEVRKIHTNVTSEDNVDQHAFENLSKFIGIAEDEKITVRFINYEKEWQSCLNDLKFNELSTKAKLIFRLKYICGIIYMTSIGRYLIGGAVNLLLEIIKKANFNYSKKTLVQAA